MIEHFVERIETSEDTRRRAVAALGLDEVNIPEKLKRENFSSDEEYFDAAALLALRHDSSEYRQHYERIRKQYNAQQRAETEAAAEKQHQQELEQAIKACVLTPKEQQQVDDAARERAQADFAAGRISFQQFGEVVERYAKDGAESAKRDRVLHDDMNMRIRAAMRAARKI